MEARQGKESAARWIPRLIMAFVAVSAIAIVMWLATRGPTKVVLTAAIDPQSGTELAEALREYNSGQNRYIATLQDEVAAGRADLSLGPYSTGGLVWRSQGWRLWARLETLAVIEGDLRRAVILPLRDAKLDGPAFEAFLVDINKKNRNYLVLPLNPALYSSALDTYLLRLGWKAPEKKAEWAAKGLLRQVPDLRSAFDDIRDGRAIFLLGNDATGALLGRASDNHPEGFPLPGSQASAGGWAIGRADAFSFPAERKPAAGAIDLVTFLTSKGIARRFAEKLPGTYYSWSRAPERGKLPSLDGPSEFIDPER